MTQRLKQIQVLSLFFLELSEVLHGFYHHYPITTTTTINNNKTKKRQQQQQ